MFALRRIRKGNEYLQSAFAALCQPPACRVSGDDLVKHASELLGIRDAFVGFHPGVGIVTALRNAAGDARTTRYFFEHGGDGVPRANTMFHIDAVVHVNIRCGGLRQDTG